MLEGDADKHSARRSSPYITKPAYHTSPVGPSRHTARPTAYPNHPIVPAPEWEGGCPQGLQLKQTPKQYRPGHQYICSNIYRLKPFPPNNSA